MGSLDRNTMRGFVLFLAATLWTGIGWTRQEIQVCGSHPLRSAEEMALHARSQALTSKRLGTRAVLRSAGRDEGHLFVLEDQGDVVSRRNLFNLDGRGIVFTPVDAEASRYRFETGASGFDADAAAAGDPLRGLDDDDSRELVLPFAFPYFGNSYSNLFLNSDGNLTFQDRDDSSSARSAGRATAGLPRISGLYRDLDPSRAPGSVRVLLSASSAIFSWIDVPDYQDFGTGPRNTFQIRLFPDGRIEFAYSAIRTRTAVVGLGRGEFRPGDAVVSFSQGDPAAVYPGAIVERFSDTEEVDTVLAARRFFESHADSFDIIAFYNDLGVAAGDGAIAWESTVRNRISGIGDAIHDDGAFYGSPQRLQGVLNMGPLSQYPDDPFAPVPGRTTAGDHSMSVLAHEFGHRWLAFVSVRDDSLSGNTPMLGRQSAHWNFFFNSEASLLEGNRIADLGAGARPRFATVAVTEAYSPLDQYLMGLRPLEDVPPTFYVANPSSPAGNRSPQVGVTFDGTRRDVTAEELAGLYGRRDPDHEISQRHFRVALVLITRPGQTFLDRSLNKLERFRQSFEPYIDRVTGGRASVDTSLRPAIRLSAWPAMAVAQGEETEVWLSLDRAPADGLELRLTAGANLEVPEVLMIPAGETSAVFRIRAAGPGVAGLRVEDPSGTLAAADAKVRVIPAP